MMPSTDEETRDRVLRDFVADVESPPLSTDTLARIAGRRANGERVALPTSDPGVAYAQRRSTRVGALLVAAAAVVIAVSLNGRRDPAGDVTSTADAMAFSPADEACASYPSTQDSSTLRHLMVSAFGVAAACGAEVQPSMPITVDPSQIRAGTYTYGVRTITDKLHTSGGAPTTITISKTTWRGEAALLAVRVGPLITRVAIDSLTVSARDLTPLHWASWYITQKPVGIMRADFDSGFVSIVLTGRFDTAATFPFPAKPGELPFGWTQDLVVPAIPLARGWFGTLRITPPIHPRAYKFVDRPWETMSLHVIGRERVTVAAGTFDCWKVQVGVPNDRSYMWVGVDNHLVVRSQTDHRFGDTEFEDQVDLKRVVYAPN